MTDPRERLRLKVDAAVYEVLEGIQRDTVDHEPDVSTAMAHCDKLVEAALKEVAVETHLMRDKREFGTTEHVGIAQKHGWNNALIAMQRRLPRP